ncbi:MAG: hypothetical protein IJ551_03465 [Prevotella sp.]|nr:hypothetical protein [Prevotella sp.]
MDRNKLSKILFWISIFCYIASCTQSAFQDEVTEGYITGIWCLAIGGPSASFCAIADLFSFDFSFFWTLAWMANPLYWISIYKYLRRRRTGIWFALCAVVIASLFYGVHAEWDAAWFVSMHRVGEKMSGYYLWVLSFVLVFVAFCMRYEILIKQICESQKGERTNSKK